ncbi:MAG: hypothetical protein AAF961_01870, partial [Planctomycetota bacterium]
RTSIASMLQDLELYKQNQISYQIIVYRDAGAPSGEIAFPLSANSNEFIADREAVAAAFGAIQAESGAPYFPELADLGVHAALTQLPWSTDDDTSRWIFLFGDAPPFDSNFDEPENKASRRVATASLASLAADKGVRVNCILCNSRAEDQEAYEAVLQRTRRFMNDLSSNTGGLMLDLSYEDIRNAIRQAAPQQQVEYRRIGFIDQEDILQAKRQAAAANSVFAENKRIRVAALPHAPLERLSFEPGERSVQLAAELRKRLRAIPGVEFKNPVMVEDRYHMLLRQGFQGEALLQMMARALDVDYVVWGLLENRGGAVVGTTGIYNQAEGRRLIKVQAATNDSTATEQLGANLAEKLIRSNVPADQDVRLRAVLAAAGKNPTVRDEVIAPVATRAAHASLMEGMEALEQALAHPVGAEEADRLLENARTALEQAVRDDDKNPLARSLYASCLFNEARALQRSGAKDAARNIMSQLFAAELRAAFANRALARNDVSLRREIEADFALFLRGNVSEAIRLYRSMLDADEGRDVRSARRAYWMLAGIYSGDWGVGEEHIDPDEVRTCLTQILALWPDSSEAEAVRRLLRWDDDQNRTRLPHMPQENAELVDQIDRSA